MENIEAQMKELLSEHLGIDQTKITPNSGILDDLGADSLDTVEIVMSIEERFSIEVSDDDMENAKTVADLIGIVERAAQKAAA